MTWRFACVSLFAFLQSILLLEIRVHADGPFVAGFERFGRHNEIEQLASGRLLVHELSCASCHKSDDAFVAAKGGPNLQGTAIRLNLAWIEKFIADPHAAKPGTTMPDVLGKRSANERAAIARELTAFLSTQDHRPDEVKGSGLLPVPNEFWNKGDPVRGKSLYHQVGCVACHDADKDVAAPTTSAVDQLIQDLDAEEIAKLGLSAAARAVPSIPFSDLKLKYKVAGLTHFILDPTQFRPAGRMPSLKLSPVESADITSYLLESQSNPASSIAFTKEEIARGRELFTELNCVQCHTASDLKPRSVATPLKELRLNSDKHCVDATTAINYRLDKEQSAAIRIALASVAKSEKLPAKDQLDLQMLAFNCFACHERDGRGGVARFRRDHFETVAKVDLGDEGRLPPALTGVGRKLQTTWLKNVLLGKKADLRPHMQIRMPVFATELANQLPELFREVDVAVPPPSDNKFAFHSAPAYSETGRQLMDVGCVQCHTFGGHSLPGVVGVDLRNANLRLRPEWFRDFLRDPSSLKARTRMPSFFPDGKSQRPDLLNGNIDDQIAAMWTYLNSKETELPEKIKEARSRNYELRPTDRPIVLRTFMTDAGTHAIAVGFPQQIHYAFDAEKVQLAIGWRGKFIDAQGTWFVRSAPPAEPLGESIIHFVDAPPIAKLVDAKDSWPSYQDNSESKYQFSGYRLDVRGVPTMLYRCGDIEVEDQIATVEVATAVKAGANSEANTFARTITLRTKTAGQVRVWFMAASDKKLTRVSDQTYANQNGLQTTLINRSGTFRTVQLPNDGKRDEWLVPIEFENEFKLELQYKW